MESKRIKKIYRTLEQWYPKNVYLKPFPVLVLMSIILIGIYIATLLNRGCYDILEHSKTNPFGFFTSLFIHNLDDLSHLSINLLGLWLFGYIVSVQTSHIRVIPIFLLCGICANIAVDIFADLMNSIVTPTFIAWVQSSGHTIDEGIRGFPSPSGGGASDVLLCLVGFAFALAIDYFIIQSFKVYQFTNSLSELMSYLQKALTDSLGKTVVHLIALLGIIVFYGALIVDLEMFSFILTHNYAGATGTFLPFPTSRGHPILAHIIGGLVGFILGIYYTKFS